jgi:hypothetical protein
MMSEQKKTEWRIICKSVIGASHTRSGRPNQDAFAQFTGSGDGLPVVLAVSDGHGSAKHFRSEKGANFAVTSAIDSLLQFQEMLASSSSRMGLEEHLAKSLVNTWRSKVNADLQREPLLSEELNALEEEEGTAARQAVEANPVLAYGATILGVMVTESFIAYLQLGDGDILAVSERGETSKVFPKNRRHFANETTSLCSSNTWRDFQFCREKVSSSASLPALILLSTDGYADSFSNEQEFLKVGSDLCEMIRSNHLEEIRSNLAGWLSEATQRGSGDDITLGILCRMDAFAKLASPEPVEQEEQTKGEDLESDPQSGHCHESLSPYQASLWDSSRREVERPMDC